MARLPRTSLVSARCGLLLGVAGEAQRCRGEAIATKDGRRLMQAHCRFREGPRICC